MLCFAGLTGLWCNGWLAWPGLDKQGCTVLCCVGPSTHPVTHPPTTSPLEKAYVPCMDQSGSVGEKRRFLLEKHGSPANKVPNAVLCVCVVCGVVVVVGGGGGGGLGLEPWLCWIG